MRTLILIITSLLWALCVNAQKGLFVTSRAFTNNDTIPAKYSCDGQNINPPLDILNVPAGTKSFAVIVHDADADTLGGYTHWVVWDILPDNSITENYKGAKQGLNSAGTKGYTGMCPQKDKHHYTFKVYALDVARLTITPDATKALLESAMKEHTLAVGTLSGMYQRNVR